MATIVPAVMISQLAETVPGAVQDSVVVESPLPGGVATAVRFLFQSVPQWFQIFGFVVGALLGLAAVVWAWRHRRAIISWLAARPRGVKGALGVAAALVVVMVGVTGMASWNYMQHDNGFCTGCHVMEGAFSRFQMSEHDSLSCHDCHQQTIFASTRQLYLWVAERPAEIGEHSPVPNAICETCHVTGEPEVWRRIASTAGHRTHLESDSSALDSVMCVTCHGQEVHRFAPVDQTCGQSGCHVNEQTTLALAEMRTQTTLHCVTCHRYTAEVPALATQDSAASATTPAFDQCTSCHEMQDMLADFEPEREPHGGTCGTCHNPHEQESAEEASQTCTTAGCHADWRGEPFHRGTSHVEVASQCALCHEPHRAAVDASDCEACHAGIAARTDIPAALQNRLRRLAPFDTSAALRRSIDTLSRAPSRPTPEPDPGHPLWALGLYGAGTMEGAPATGQLTAAPDSFDHVVHEGLACLTCHRAASGHGGLTFEAPRGCQICHHDTPRTLDCGTCHTGPEIAPLRAATLSLAVADTIHRTRQVGFAHADHDGVACLDCHAAPVTLAAGEEVRTCASCHAQHHTEDRRCAGCHVPDPSDGAHGPPTDGHTGCTNCHRSESVTGLVPDDKFCRTCHGLEGEHYADTGRACTTCHFLQSPHEFRSQLIRTGSLP